MSKFLSKMLIKKFASRPRTPSTDTTKVVNEARRRVAASEYFFFFASSADERMAETTCCEWDRASVSVTRTSNNATVWGCHTPLILRSMSGISAEAV